MPTPRDANKLTVFADPPPLVDGLGPGALADALVAVVVLRCASPVAIQPESDASAIHVKRGSMTLAAFRVALDVGNATVARLAKMANLDPFVDATSIERHSNLARVYATVAGRKGTVLVGVGATPEGLEAELFPVGLTPAHEARAGAMKRCLICGTWQDGHRTTCEEDGGPLSHAIDDPVPGGTVGAYRILRRLGDGATGSVLEAEHSLIGRRVAIKLLHDEGSPTSGGFGDARRFIAEARAATRVRHPNVVEVTDYGLLSDGRPFLVMELVEGESLETRIERSGAMSPAAALRIAREIALGLEAAHRAGVVHNDLKPSNVMLLEGSTDDAPVLKVVDFGAASSMEAAESAEDPIVGTPAYMAPERALGAPFDGRADIYALGAILHEMLSGKPLFVGDSARELMRAQITEPPSPPSSAQGPLHGSISGVVERALRKSPEERQQSASELIREMDDALKTLARPGWRRWLP